MRCLIVDDSVPWTHKPSGCLRRFLPMSHPFVFPQSSSWKMESTGRSLARLKIARASSPINCQEITLQGMSLDLRCTWPSLDRPNSVDQILIRSINYAAKCKQPSNLNTWQLCWCFPHAIYTRILDQITRNEINLEKSYTKKSVICQWDCQPKVSGPFWRLQLYSDELTPLPKN